MKTALNKIWRDLARNKGRTFLVVMSIAVGVLAVGMITSSNTLIQQQLSVVNAAAMSSHGRISLNGSIDRATLLNLEEIPGISAVDGRLSSGVEWKGAPNDDWNDSTIRALSSYENQKFDLIDLREGEWPVRDFVVVAYNQIVSFNVPIIGEKIYFNINDRQREYEVIGIFRDPNVLSTPFDETPTFYISTELFREIAGFERYGQVRILLPTYSEAAVQAAADRIERNLERQGVGVRFVNPTDPSEHWAKTIVDGVGLILTIMAVASLGLSTFLIINTMNALMVQQIPQIGMMKTVGGLSRQITIVYLTGVAVYGILALLVAVPLGTYAGDALAKWMLNFINIPPAPFELVPTSFVIQILTGLFAPLLAGLFPILRGVAIPVARAISAYGLGQGQYGGRIIDRILGKIRGLPRLTILTLRNTFRRPGRVAMTQITLIVAGAIFMMVLSTQQSFNQTIDKIFEGFGFDVLLIFEQQQLIDEIIPQVETRPNVGIAEMWVFSGGFAKKIGADESDEQDLDLQGIPKDTQLYTPELTAGRNLHPDDGHAILLNQKLAAEMGVGLSDQIVIRIDGFDDSIWTIVGLTLDLGGNSGTTTAYVHRDTLNAEINQNGRAGVVEIKGTIPTIETQRAIEEDLTQYFESEGLRVAYTTTALENKEQANAQFSILTTVLLIMTVLIAAVGGFGLSGTLSINVIERTREIGVMRAVGASSSDIGKIFIGEGLLHGAISWVIGIPLSTLAGGEFVNALGSIIDFPFTYQFSSQSVFLWLAIITFIALIASWLPAQRATQISVQESLAYE